MASMSCLFVCPILHHKTRIISSNGFSKCKPIYSVSPSASTAFTTVEPVVRRSANYEPTLWSFDHIQSLSSNYTGESYVARADLLKEEVRKMLRKVDNRNLSSTLELIDDLQRLGIAYHFEDEISNVLDMMYTNHYQTHDKWDGLDLNVKALGFRLLRQHGHQVPQEIFSNFKDKIQGLKPHFVEDMVCILNLYEASYHSFEDESTLDDVRDFTTMYLKQNIENMNEDVSSLVSHALEIPLHWRVPRIEARWFIEGYEQRKGVNRTVIELAKLDFNMVQAIHIEDLKHSSRWWNNTKWDEKLNFSRDRLVEHFMWALGFDYLPQFSSGRKMIAMVNSMITAIDDIYDVYGTLDELERFTNIIDRWDINAIEELPDYMKICFIGFYNAINEITYNTMIDTGFFILPYLKNVWAELCKSYLVEARWYHNRYTPTLQEYLNNAHVSIAGRVILMHANLSTSFTSTEGMLQCFERAENIIRYSSIIFRLANDIATSPEEMARGDSSKAIQCYMNESGATEDGARAYIKSLILETWKKLNKERAFAKSQVSSEFIECATNIPRMALFMYNEGDGHGHPDITKSEVLSLLFNPIHG